jgi:hypothetical protein
MKKYEKLKQSHKNINQVILILQKDDLYNHLFEKIYNFLIFIK